MGAKVYYSVKDAQWVWKNRADKKLATLSDLGVLDFAKGVVTGEEHGLDVTVSGTLSSGDGLVGANLITTLSGTAGAWGCSLFAKVIQGSTKSIDGYLNAAEFELINSAANASAMAVITLNWNNSATSPGAPGGSTQAYIQLREYSSGTPCSNLFEFTDVTIGSASATVLITPRTASAVSHGIKMTVKNTPYWIMLSNAL